MLEINISAYVGKNIMMNMSVGNMSKGSDGNEC